MLKTLSTALLLALLTFGQAWVLPAYSALQTSPLVASSRFVSDVDQVLQTANAQVGKTQRLNRLIVVDELPRSPIGKVLKRELRDRLAG